ncbi:GNAT family N-acetyltransferase [Hymenobacter negativus]|uniref:GNAT family N-acetyltransferase n=1 Tax=Hymenobacter negativus TaxID=2795026 RepID=A0ABS3QAT4_9BACT|nr:GNAT family N-acetyltransferase [Hymenobacter negativus]MBO2008272.1 GNAT family N-acetyltransferase [Hymenobacter negativus]
MPADVSIIDFEPVHQHAFRALNYEVSYEWISRYFSAEAPDNQSLDYPQRRIVDTGGHILMAEHKGEIVGTCALVKEHDGVYELAKMAVALRAQRLGIGYALGQCILGKARQLGARSVEVLLDADMQPALALYDKLGFRPAPLRTMPYYRGDTRLVLDL